VTSTFVEEQAVRERVCLASITALVEEHPDVTGALVSTVDGFPVAAHLRQPDAAPRLAAMTSSLIALAEAISREAHAGECRDLVIEGSTGRVLMMDVPQPAGKLLLSVLCAPTATLGQVLWAAQHCRRDISARLAGQG
jgi:uncharacterized protein